MIIFMQGRTFSTPAATVAGMDALLCTLVYSINKFHAEGKPLSNQG